MQVQLAAYFYQEILSSVLEVVNGTWKMFNIHLQNLKPIFLVLTKIVQAAKGEFFKISLLRAHAVW